MVKNYVVTGVSGSGRIELLDELKSEFEKRGKNANVFDIGKIIFDSAKELRIGISDQKVLDVDRDLLVSLRKIALLKVLLTMTTKPADFNFIGIHATFRWRERLIGGVTYRDLRDLIIDGFINVIDDVQNIYQTNAKNPKWQDVEGPTLEETNDWIMEEEFVTEVLADFFDVPIFLVGRRHNIQNLADLFLTDKMRVYLSYPVTLIREDNPQLLDKIRKEIKPQLESSFIVFDPLVIKDMELTYRGKIELPNLVEYVSEKAVNLLSTRTVERDFQFIDQSDFVVVIYLTGKASPGVLSEIIYACKHNKPVFMVFPYSRSPFLQENTTRLFSSETELLDYFGSVEFRERFKPRCA